MKYAIVLSAGKGTRMCSSIPKQYMDLMGKPVIYYALKAFEESCVDKVVLVCGAGDEKYCQEEIVEKYGLKKVTAVVEGGAYRFESVFNGLKAMGQLSSDEYVAVHDGARPVVTAKMINSLFESAKEKGNAVAACPVKDTIKIVDDNAKVLSTPDRSSLWQVQTPQVFEAKILKECYIKQMDVYDTGVTDDAMVVEKYSGQPVYLYDTGYKNIKITTPEDLKIAELFI